jgi:hypothetical protein
MKVTVTFEFNLPEEKYDLQIQHRASEFYLAIEDIRDMTRKVLKYGTDKDVHQLAEEIRELLPHSVEE